MILIGILLLSLGSCVQLPLSTKGNKIVDAAGAEVRLACVNWYGAHLERYVVDGLDTQPLDNITRKIASLGFNCVRLVYSLDMVHLNPVVNASALVANP